MTTTVTASKVSELRAKTGAGMLACRNALVEANGDLQAAAEALKISGQAAALKKSGRIAAEGIVCALHDAATASAAIVEINCETDFVAKQDSFRDFAKSIAASAFSQGAAVLQSSESEQARQELVAKIGENISLRRLELVNTPEGGSLGVYLHGADHEFSRIGVIVALDKNDPELAYDLAMHAAAMRPEYIDESQVPESVRSKETEILMAQAKENDGDKPENILEKIVDGRVAKFIAEITLSGQSFLKDPNQKVSSVLQAKGTKVLKLVRFEVGEGIEKKETDFAAEVMEQARGR